MNSQDFLTINLIGAGAFLVWYFVSRGGPAQPTRLNMKARDTAPTVLEPAISENSAQSSSFQDAPSSVPGATVRGSSRSHQAEKPTMKALNVMFNYNGHSWDAYEVLGVPAGASITIVTEAYQTALRRCTGQESVEFLETAYKAILNKSA